MFHLFLTISLDALQKGLERLLLFLPKLIKVLYQCLFELVLYEFSLKDFLLLYHHVHRLSLIIVFN
jgi:hypothetical protein